MSFNIGDTVRFENIVGFIVQKHYASGSYVTTFSNGWSLDPRGFMRVKALLIERL